MTLELTDGRATRREKVFGQHRLLRLRPIAAVYPYLNYRLKESAHLASPSVRVVYAALAGDLAVASAKFGAAALSGSSAMFTEAIHSLVDSADQLLLLTGQYRARNPPDRTHPLGYGMETYFWSFVVALFVFFLGGLVAFYQGVRHILMPQPIVSPAISLGVLVVSLSTRHNPSEACVTIG